MQKTKITPVSLTSCAKFALLLMLLPAWAYSQANGKLDSNFIKASKVKIEMNRKRDVKITVANPNGSAGNLKVSIRQIRNHFGFGASIGYDHLNSVPGYAESFLKYYEWAVFENDMKWPSTDPTPDGPDYAKADSLIRFCEKHDIKVRGHNLFWNQQEEWFPSWTLPLGPAGFKAAVDDRINDAMNHFKGKVDQWDIVNEPIHGTVLQDHSGDPDFINSIFTRSRAIDSSAKLGVNDFNILVWNSADDYIARIKSMLAAKVPVDIVGCEGHMGNQLHQDYAANLDKVATLGLPIWITEMDFTAAGNVADEFERLMRTFFGHPKVEGVMMWVWWGGNKWREDLNSNVVNTDFSQTALGDRFLKLRKEWSTLDSGSTDDSGSFAFRGFHGKYVVTVSSGSAIQTDTLYLEPGTGSKEWKMSLQPVVGIENAEPAAAAFAKTLFIEGMPVTFFREENSSLSVSLFGADGKFLGTRMVQPGQSQVAWPTLPRGYYCYRIRSAHQVLKEGMGFKLRD